MTLNILGTEYEVIEQSKGENPKLDGASGLCEIYAKKIVLDKDLLTPKPDAMDNLELMKKKILRHEIVHAFFVESGLLDFCYDETLVDHLAFQVPKMVKVMQDADCL